MGVKGLRRHVSGVETKRGQLDFLGKEITNKPAGY
jgi:hypothetical protein